MEPLAKRPRASPPPTTGHNNAADDLPVFKFDFDFISKEPQPTPTMHSICQVKHAGVLRDEGGVMEWIRRTGSVFGEEKTTG